MSQLSHQTDTRELDADRRAADGPSLPYRWPDADAHPFARRELAFDPGPVLFLASVSQHLDTALLLRRFALDATVIPLCDHNPPANGFGTLGIYWPEHALQADAIHDRLRAALDAQPSLILMGPEPPLANYPADIRQRLSQLIADGSTLALFNAPADDIAKVDCAPPKARVLSIDNGADPRRGYLDGDSSSAADFDRSLRDLARRLLAHCPGYRPVIQSLEADGAAIRVQADAEHAATLRLTVCRAADCGLVAEADIPIDGEQRVRLADFAVDSYYVLAEALDADARLLDWTTLDLTIGDPAARALRPDRAVVAAGELLRLSIDGPEPQRIELRWTDNLGRVLLANELPASRQFGVPQSSLSVRNRVDAMLHDADGTTQLLSTEILMPTNADKLAPSFRFFVWNICDRFSWRDQAYFEALHESALADGICNCTTDRGAAEQAARAGMTTVPYSAWFHKIGLDDCLFSEEWMEKTRQRALAAVRHHRDFGPAGYTLGDECYMDAFTPGGRFSASESVWAAFRDFLHESYGSLAALNAQWETDFSDWDAVHLASDAALLPSTANPSAWTDFRMFTARTFAARFQELRRLIQAESPGALVGWDGCEQYSSYDGIDWWEFSREMAINVVYAGSTLGCTDGYGNRTFNSQAVKSFNPDAPLSGAFLNNINGACGAEHSPWLLLLQGYTSMWWWHASYPQPEYGALNWDLSRTPVMEQLAATMRELRGGVADLIRGADRVRSPIAIHYSANNFHASTIESGAGNHINNLGIAKAEFWTADRIIGRTISANAELTEMFGDVRPSGHYAAAYKNMLLLFKDMGHQPDTLARQQIETGSLQDQGYRVLVLPFVVSLSDAEVAAIRDFVTAGGLLIADYRCGLRDLHGKMRTQPALDDLFGIRRQSDGTIRGPAQVDVEYSFSRGGRWQVMFRDDIGIEGTGCVLQAYDDGTPMPNDGTAVYGCHADGSPAFIVNHHGAGKTLYLNFDLYDYWRLRQCGAAADTVDTFRFLLATLADVRQDQIPKDRAGAPSPAVETIRYRDGGIDYVGLLPDFAVNDRRPQDCRLDFPADRVVYDLRRQTRLGSGSQSLTLTPGQPVLLASLPADPVLPTLGATVIDEADRLISIQLTRAADAGAAMPLTLRLEFRDPTGALVEHYTRVVRLNGERQTLAWTPALNDPAGPWNVRAIEVISGQERSIFIDTSRLK